MHGVVAAVVVVGHQVVAEEGRARGSESEELVPFDPSQPH